jgi:hypothetical protein
LGEFSKIPWKFKTYGIMGKDKWLKSSHDWYWGGKEKYTFISTFLLF